jgi:hypothetical protein
MELEGDMKSDKHFYVKSRQAEGPPVRKLIGAEYAKHETTETFTL